MNSALFIWKQFASPLPIHILYQGDLKSVRQVTGSSISMDGIQFDLKQFHFHSPSEHQINSKSFPLETHLVHSDKDGVEKADRGLQDDSRLCQ